MCTRLSVRISASADLLLAQQHTHTHTHKHRIKLQALASHGFTSTLVKEVDCKHTLQIKLFEEQLQGGAFAPRLERARLENVHAFGGGGLRNGI